MPGAKVVLDGSNPDLWWLVGHFLGDGQGRSDRPDIGWSVGGTDENRNRVQSILRSLGLSSWLWGVPGNEAVFTSSTHLTALMKSFGSHAWSKHVPPEVLSFPRKHLEALLDGYLAADGNFRSDRANPEWRATSVSLPLLQGLQRISWQLGWSAGISRQDYARKAVIQGRLVNCRDSWGLSIKKSVHSQSRSKFEKDHIWRSVCSVSGEQVESVEVIDFEVAEDHTFCLPGVVVHNCQGHSRARGKDRPHHDVQRSTAWAVVSCAEYHRQEFFVVENVVDFMDWALYPSWLDAMRRLGYAASENIIDAADHGVPQHRERLFMVFSRSRAPIDLNLEKRPHVSVDSVIDWDYPDWTPIEKPGRSLATLARIASGRERFGRRFVTPYYGSGSGKTGRSIHRPIGTITTRARWAIVDGDRMRMLNRNETKRIMGFPEEYALPPTLRASTHMLGNAVCPPVPADILTALAARG
jgi:DNA (cytosine-5)-methyltransferase 1